MIPCMYTYRAAAFWIVGGYQEGKLKHGPSVDPTTHTQQSIPYFGREEREITFSTNTAVIKKNSLNAEVSEGNTYTPGTGCCSN